MSCVEKILIGNKFKSNIKKDQRDEAVMRANARKLKVGV